MFLLYIRKWYKYREEISEELALVELELLKDKWGTKYPYVISNWEANWDVVRLYFNFSDEIRRIMYTTNIIEGLNRQFRKVTKTKSHFANDVSSENMIYLASMNVIKKCTQSFITGILKRMAIIIYE